MLLYLLSVSSTTTKHNLDTWCSVTGCVSESAAHRCVMLCSDWSSPASGRLFGSFSRETSLSFPGHHHHHHTSPEKQEGMSWMWLLLQILTSDEETANVCNAAPNHAKQEKTRWWNRHSLINSKHLLLKQIHSAQTRIFCLYALPNVKRE